MILVDEEVFQAKVVDTLATLLLVFYQACAVRTNANNDV